MTSLHPNTPAAERGGDALAPSRDARIVMLGGGHAHVAALRHLAARRRAAPRIVLVTRHPDSLYSGLLPGVIRHEEAGRPTVDLARLADRSGAELVLGEAAAIDLTRRLVRVDGRPLDFDVLSLDLGAGSETLAGTIPVRPIEALPEHVRRIEMSGRNGTVAVIGAGPAGVELAFALATRWRGSRPVALVSRSAEPLPAAPGAARRFVRAALAEAGVTVHASAAATGLRDGVLGFVHGGGIACEAALNATGVCPPPLLATSGLALDRRGFVAVDGALRSLSHPFVFAAGDCAAFAPRPLPKGGVWAVRAGPVLGENLRRAATGGAPRAWWPQRTALTIIGLGGGRALAWKDGFWLAGRAAWWWKNWLDRRWLAVGEK